MHGPGPSVKPPAHNVAWIYITHTCFLQAQKTDCSCSAVCFPHVYFFKTVVLSDLHEGKRDSLLHPLPNSVHCPHAPHLCHLEDVFPSSHFLQAFLLTPLLQKLLGFNAIYPKWTGTIK